MNKTIYQSIVLLSITLLLSCSNGLFGKTGKGTVVTQKRTVTNFEMLELQTDADIEVMKGDSFRVEVSDYENIIEHTSVEVINGKLIISRVPLTTMLLNSKAQVKITMPDVLRSVLLIGSGDIVIKSAFKELETMKITGSGDISSNQEFNLLKLDASIVGSGNMTLKGNVDDLTALISGSGNLNLPNLIAKNAKCKISGSGNISIYVSNKLYAIITGSGNITYSGNPIVETTISGSGIILHR